MYDVIIVGAGVSGIACALHIDNNYKTLLIDGNDIIGKKLSITGNGRCNITNSNYGKDFLENIHNYKFMYSSFSTFDNFSLMELMQKYNVELKEEANGRMFPTTNKASTIIQAFEKHLDKVEIKLSEVVEEIKNEDNFTLVTNKGTYKTKKLVIATGGLSYPDTGSSGFGIKYAKITNHKITRLIASEAPIYTDDEICKNLQGVTLENCAIKYNKKSYSGYNLLISHFGLSGPLAFRQCFNIINNEVKQISIDFTPNVNQEQLKNELINSNSIKNVLKQYMTKSTADYLISKSKIDSTEFSKLGKKQQEQFLTIIKSYPIKISKYADVSKGFTTAGGIDVKQIDNKTFESKLIPNLYFIGEVLDVHAHTGGYNISTFLSMRENCDHKNKYTKYTKFGIK